MLTMTFEIQTKIQTGGSISSLVTIGTDISMLIFMLESQTKIQTGEGALFLVIIRIDTDA